MTFYNICIPLVIRQANAVKENPGPTIFDVVDPTTTVCAHSSQGNESPNPGLVKMMSSPLITLLFKQPVQIPAGPT